MNDPTLEPVIVRFIAEHALDSVDGAFAYRSGEDLDKPGLGHRRRTRLQVRDEENRTWELYLKRYGKASLWTRLKRLVSFRRGFCEAEHEFETVRQLRQAGVPTMRQICWDAEYDLLGVVRSFLIVTAVPGEALERCGEDFLQANIKNPKVLEAFTDELVYVVRRLHESGFVHRDLYASHLFLHDREGQIRIFLIDLARAFRPRWRRFRWRVKDLAQLKFSMPWIWVTLYWDRFLWRYLDLPEIEQVRRWDRAIARKVARMEKRHWRKHRQREKRST
jgi:tRNA A-37 threonylcarbamoyl transferase component Bud32